MLKKAALIVASILGVLWFIGTFIDKGPTSPAVRQQPLRPDVIYLTNAPPRIPDPRPDDPQQTARRMTAAQRQEMLNATVRRYGTPGASSWQDVKRALVWSDLAVRWCPSLAYDDQAKADIIAAWDIHTGGDADTAVVVASTREALSALSNNFEFCRTSWARYGHNGAIASLLRRTDGR